MTKYDAHDIKIDDFMTIKSSIFISGGCIMNEKTKSILAYVFGWLGGLIVLFGVKDNERNTRFHAAQAIVIGVAYLIITTAYRFIPIVIPFFGTAMWILYLVLMVMGIIKANKEEEPELPVVGDIAKSIFGKKIEE